MKQQRLDGLADGIFAIIMTLLAFELKIPVLLGEVNDISLLQALSHVAPSLLIFILTFALLFTYWRAHHFLTSVYAKTLSVGLANYNALFFLFITLVPFSADLLGHYSSTHVAIFVYGINIIVIGLTLLAMRIHIEKNNHIEKAPITHADRRSGYIRIIFPVFAACLSILLSYWNTSISIVLFTIAIIFNILPASSNIIHGVLDRLFKDDHELVQ
ncbi:MAG: hypothetical protein RL094_751 [Candidatus Parcubacteria bacterium]|jgi:uncharacterized membrane protein